MSAKGLFVGLCGTCNNANDCVYRKLRGTDAIYCELFDVYVAPISGSGKPVPSVSRSATAANGFRDLCVNCAHVDDCVLKNPKGGVWHCEEYE